MKLQNVQTDVTTLCKSNFDCVNNAECIEDQCFCKDGFKAIGAECVDVDECLSNPCGPASICSNTRGSYHCECESGFVGTPPHIPCKGKLISNNRDERIMLITERHL